MLLLLVPVVWKRKCAVFLMSTMNRRIWCKKIISHALKYWILFFVQKQFWPLLFYCIISNHFCFSNRRKVNWTKCVNNRILNVFREGKKKNIKSALVKEGENGKQTMKIQFKNLL